MGIKTYEIVEAGTATVLDEHESWTLSSGLEPHAFDETQRLVDSVDLLGRVRNEEGDGEGEPDGSEL